MPALLLLLFFHPQNTNYESIQQTARSIAEQAHVLAYDPNYMSPFAQFACDNGLNVRGQCLSPNTWSLTLVSFLFHDCFLLSDGHHFNGALLSLCRRKAR